MLNDEQRKRIENRLLEEREAAVQALRGFDAQSAETLEDEAGELSSYRFHMADLGTESMEREKQFLLGSKEGERLYEVDEALRRLYRDPERFGVCERCGRQISMERLELVPAARHCARCAEGEERGSSAAEG